MNIKNFIMSLRSVTVIGTDNNPYPIPCENPMYNNIVKFLKRGNFTKAGELFDISKTIQKHSSGKFYVKDNQVYTEDGAMPKALSDRVIQFATNGIDIDPLMKFFSNLAQNPSEDSKKDLYAFLEHNNIPITCDGCFIAYKKVNNEYKDCHTNSYDNSIGAVVKMDRNSVDDDRNVTCSRGLHAAAFNYASNFSSNGHLMEVKINPKDVVSVPIDYNNQKMRVCEYIVTAEVYEPNTDILYTKDDSYVPNQENEEEEEKGTLCEAEEVDMKDIVIKTDSEERIRIPSKVMKAAGFSAGDKAHVILDVLLGTIDIVKVKTDSPLDGYDSNIKTYTADEYNNLRISVKGFGNTFNVTNISKDNNCIELFEKE